MSSYSSIRAAVWENNRRDALKPAYFGFTDWKTQPYTAAKMAMYSEVAAILLFFLQYTKISPNAVSMAFAFTGVCGAVLLSLTSDRAVVLGLAIFVFKSVLDACDGNLARLVNRCSDEGAVLDEWGALVNSFAFQVGLGFYLYNRTGDITYFFLMVLMLVLRGIDLRHFTYVMAINMILEGRALQGRGSSSSDSQAPVFGQRGWAARLAPMLVNFLDDRARTVDLVCLLVFIEVMTGKLWVMPFVYWAYGLKSVLTFAGGWYLLYVKKMSTQLNGILFGARESKG